MKTAKDFYYQKLFSLSDKPVNLLNPDRNKDAPINSSNETEAIVEETAGSLLLAVVKLIFLSGADGETALNHACKRLVERCGEMERLAGI